MTPSRTLRIARIVVLGVTLAACGGPGGLQDIDTSDAIPVGSILFYEDFEDYPVGAFPGGGWIDILGGYVHKIVDIPSNHKLLLEGPIQGQRGAARHDFTPGIRPTYIRYQAHPYPDYQPPLASPQSVFSTGAFLLSGMDAEGVLRPVIGLWFVSNSQGLGSLHANHRFYPQSVVNWMPMDRSFRIQLKNINWQAYPYLTFDLWINGQEMAQCIPFWSPVASLTELSLYNNSYGRVHYDNILMADIEVDHLCPHVSQNPPGPPGLAIPPLESPSPSPLIEFPRFIVGVDAFCRLGPTTAYPALDYFPADAMLTATGQNEDGTWWWIDEFGCWISDAVGELDGDPSNLPLIGAPPLPEAPPEQPTGCLSTLDPVACVAAGGTWNPSTYPGRCDCP